MLKTDPAGMMHFHEIFVPFEVEIVGEHELHDDLSLGPDLSHVEADVVTTVPGDRLAQARLEDLEGLHHQSELLDHHRKQF